MVFIFHVLGTESEHAVPGFNTADPIDAFADADLQPWKSFCGVEEFAWKTSRAARPPSNLQHYSCIQPLQLSNRYVFERVTRGSSWGTPRSHARRFYGEIVQNLQIHRQSSSLPVLLQSFPSEGLTPHPRPASPPTSTLRKNRLSLERKKSRERHICIAAHHVFVSIQDELASPLRLS